MCCVCQGGWLDGYDPAGDMATETLLDGEYTRPECIHAVKKIAGANAASMDDTATDEVAGSCWAVTKLSKGLNESDVVTEWELDARASLTRSSAKASVMCCVCQGGWLDGYDPAGDMATETLLDGEYTRPECI